MTSKNKNMLGFTLVEMAVVLTIVGLLIGGGFYSLGAFLDNAKQSSTQGSLLVTKQALLNYVKVNKHMPCPDSDGDGDEERTGGLGTRCSVYLGTIPYDDLGLSRAVVSDEYNNLFGYAVHKETSSAVMDLNVASTAGQQALLLQPGSYFYNLSAPVFDLDTPPTALNLDDASESYSICKREALDDCSGANDIEMQFIPAVIIAYNENGDNTGLDICTGSRGARESENCNTSTEVNPTFVRGIFSPRDYDDQIITISAYEIKEQALGDFKDPPTASSDYDSEYEGYDVIIRGDMDSSNDLNVADGVDNAFYLDQNDDGSEEGSLNANVVFKAGNDTFHIEGNVESGGNAKMGAGDDEVFVGQDVQSGAIINLGDSTITTDAAGDVILIVPSEIISPDKDTLIVNGNVDDGAKIYGDDGNDLITLNGDINGLVDLGKDNDLLIINQGVDNAIVIGSTADIVGGIGDDVLVVQMDKVAWDAAWTAGWDSIITGFEFLSLEGEGGLLTYNSSGNIFE